ncbi:sulfotransferase [Sphingobacterium faecium]|uniref:sulfotransferase n=1 Tax=Sphingobacterium faecium TaxID=34087 RepID=UPI00320A259A
MKFIILCPTRSGSNLLVNLLSCHEELKTFGEIFSLDRLTFGEVESIIDFPIEYLNQKLSSNSKLIFGTGFKMLYDNFTLDYFEKEVSLGNSHPSVTQRNNKLIDFVFNRYSEERLRQQFNKLWRFLSDDKKIKIIHLTRRNLLESFVSLKKAFITDKWISIKEDKADIFKIELEKVELESYFNRIVNFKNYYAELFSEHQVLNLYYEDLASSREHVITNVFDFLGIRPMELTSILKKQNRVCVRDSVNNYEQLKQDFSETKWSIFFE